MRRARLIVGLLMACLFVPCCCFAQIPAASFSIPGQACLKQNIIPHNTSVNSVSSEWDFCQGDLSLTPAASYLGAVGGAVTLGVDVVFDGTHWFGFITSRETGSVIRLDFGTDYNATPVKTDLGNIGGVMGRPVDIKVIRDNGIWYGFVYSEATPTTLISRINFGSSLTNTTSSATPITADVVVPGNGVFNSNGGFDMVAAGPGWVIVYTQPTSVNVVRLTTISAVPSAADMLTGSPLTGSVGSTSLGDVKLIKSNGQWFGYVSDWQNREFYRLSFGTSIFSLPASTDFGSVFLAGQTPYGADGGFDNGQYYLLLSTLSGSLVRVNLGADLTQAPVNGTSIGNLNLLNTTFKIKLFSYQSQWVGFTVDYTNQHFYRVAFPSPACGTAPSFSSSTEPSLSYSAAGPAYVSLKSFNADGNFDEADASVTVLSGTAPVIDFQNQFVCAQFPVNFTYSSPQTLHGFQWNFGNGDNSTMASPSEVFSSAGNYTVDFIAVAPNGCVNLVRKPITIYSAPVANFSLPSPSLSCSNQSYTFQNTSTVANGSAPVWQWSVNGVVTTSAKDLAFAFATTGSQNISLDASIPGCSTNSTQSFNVQQQGPAVDFSSADGCQNKSVQFNNNSTGSITGYSWDFNDGNTSTAFSPAHSFSGIGNYNVSLTVSNPLGCNNSVTKQINIYTTPAVDFMLELPPFSCSGSASQFTDTTPNMSDSNIAGWTWNFGDASNNTSSAQNPTHTYATAANYTVGLTVITDRNCSAAIQKQVTIQQTPTAAFTNNAACLNHLTTFSDASSADVVSWVWTIDGNILNTQNPTYTFGTVSQHTVQLEAKSSNNCIGRISKNVSVPVPPSLSFSQSNLCTNNDAVFTDTTPAGADPIASINWDFNGVGSGSGSPVMFSFSDAGAAEVAMNATTASGCVYSFEKNIVIVASPVAGFTASTETGEPPLSVFFTNTSTGATSYRWSIAGTTTTDVSTSFVFKTLGNFPVQLTAFGAGGCTDVFSKTIHAAMPGLDLAIDSAIFSLDATKTILTVHYLLENVGNVPVVNPVIHLEIAGDRLVTDTASITILPGVTLKSSLQLSNVSAAVQFACVFAEVSGDINNLNNKQCISLNGQDLVFEPWPNPATGQFYLEWIAGGTSTAGIAMYSVFGQRMMEQEIAVAEDGLQKTVIDVSPLPAGVYLVVFNYRGLKRTFRIIVD